MAEKPAIVEKDYRSAFALDKSKLSRMLTIIEEKFESTHLQFQPEFSVRLSNDKRIDLSSTDELFALDNAIRNPISSLAIKASTSENATSLESYILFTDRERDNIELKITSSNANTALQLFAELEEQLERTFLKHLVYKFFKSRMFTLVFPMLFAILSGILITIFLPTSSRVTSNLPDETINELLINAENLTSLEDKVDFLFGLNVKQLENTQTTAKSINFGGLFNLKTFFIMLPLVIVVGCAYYAIAHCYPRAVFQWGDCEEHYSRLISTRNTLWIVVVLSIILGIITNLFVLGLADVIN